MEAIYMLGGAVLSFLSSSYAALYLIQKLLSLQRRSARILSQENKGLYERIQAYIFQLARKLECDNYRKNRLSMALSLGVGMLFVLFGAPFAFVLMMALCSFFLCRFVPTLLVQQKEKERMEQALAEFPNLIDIVALGMSAGISFDSALELYCMRSNSALSRRMFEALHSWKNGIYSRKEVFEQLCQEYEFEGMRRFCDSVSESLSFGMPLSGSLEEQSVKMRKEHQSYIQEKIEKAPVKMLIPIGVLILPAMLLTIVGPLLASALLMGS